MFEASLSFSKSLMCLPLRFRIKTWKSSSVQTHTVHQLVDEIEETTFFLKAGGHVQNPLTHVWNEKFKDTTEGGAMKDAGVKIGGVAKRLTDSPVVVVTWQRGHSKLPQACHSKDQVGMTTGPKTLEINPNHLVVIDLLAKVRVTQPP